jgi:hypothetical protein
MASVPPDDQAPGLLVDAKVTEVAVKERTVAGEDGLRGVLNPKGVAPDT